MWFSVCLFNLILNTGNTACRFPGSLQSIVKSPGQSAILLCSCTDPNTRPANVIWEFSASGFETWEPVTQSDLYRNRVEFNETTLLLSHLTKKDQGYYRCNMRNAQFRNFFLRVQGCTLSGQQETPIEITVSSGQSVLLPCSCTDLQTRPASFIWEFLEQHTSAWVPVTQSDLYRGRMELFNETTPGNLSLLLSHLTEKDQGYYRCEIPHYQFRDVHLTVRACTLPGNRQNIDKSQGQSAILLCSCTDPNTRPANVIWEFSASGFETWVPVTQSDLYRNRVEFNETTLLLSNLTKKDQGYYRCNMRNAQFRDFFLHVQGPPPPQYIPFALLAVLIFHLMFLGVFLKTRGTSTKQQGNQNDLSKAIYENYSETVEIQ
ncbi:carcinoembryonic antigen-related cell adhesion molecule 3-like [Osmerus mordax]|uniref:carcinoembryonic antigen-related cell adhesion molecule 3-like n=1 Tax=Osmerus mordax TaxID=8014 RepID=UPI003510B08C